MKKFRKIPSLKFLYEIDCNGVIRNVKSKKICKTYFAKNGYERVSFHNNTLTSSNKVLHCLVHRLVAECWCKPPEHLKECDYNELQVNHIDGNKKNNNYKNLEWVLPYENIRHAVKNGLRTETEKWKEQKFQKKPIVCVEENLTFESSYQAAEWLINKMDYKKKYTTVANVIREAARKRKKTAYGYHWEYI